MDEWIVRKQYTKMESKIFARDKSFIFDFLLAWMHSEFLAICIENFKMFHHVLPLLLSRRILVLLCFSHFGLNPILFNIFQMVCISLKILKVSNYRFFLMNCNKFQSFWTVERMPVRRYWMNDSKIKITVNSILLTSGWSFMCSDRKRLASSMYGRFSSSVNNFHSAPRRFEISEF